MKAAVVAFVGRLCVILWVIALSYVVEPYDSSQETRLYTQPRSIVDDFVLKRLSRFSNWDGVFFTHLAQAGYDKEQFHAFFPLLPLVIRCTR